MKTYKLEDAEFQTAEDKRLVLVQFNTFLKNGMKWKHFTDRLYKHLTLHCSFIAHYNRAGFYGVYFEDPAGSVRFLNQFYNGNSVEYGGNYWIDYPGSRDVNEAMIDICQGYYHGLVKKMHDKLIIDTKIKIAVYEKKLTELEGKI